MLFSNLIRILNSKQTIIYMLISQKQTNMTCIQQMMKKLRVIWQLNSLQLIKRSIPRIIIKNILKDQPAKMAKRERINNPAASSCSMDRYLACQGVGGSNCFMQSKHIDYKYKIDLKNQINLLPTYILKRSQQFIKHTNINCYHYNSYQKKRQMIMEIEHPAKRRASAQKILYPHYSISINNYRQMLQLYLKDRTFNEAIDGFRQLDPEEVQKLKIICDMLFFNYQERVITLGDLQGIWPLLTFLIPNINGLQIYLSFEYLITPRQIKQLNPQVKEEQRQFDPQGYFQNSKWIHKKKFVQSMRKLQRQLSKRSQQDSIKSCLKILELISSDNYQYISSAKDFRDSYEQFKSKITKEYKSRKIIEQSPFFNCRLFQQDVILSQPDMMHNVIRTFTKEQYRHHHQTITMRPLYKPIQELQENQSQNNESEYQSTITIKQRKTSLGTKRRYGQEKSNNNTPVRKYIKAKPLKRNKFAECFFELDIKKNKILQDIKKNKRRQEKQNKRKKRLQKIQKEINYFSDDQQQNRGNRQIKQKRSNKRIEAQSQPQNRLSLNKKMRQQSFIDDSEQQIVMKRRRLHKKPRYDFDQQESSEEEEDHLFYPKPEKKKMVIQEQEIILGKINEYSIGKSHLVLQSNEHRVMEKLVNLLINRLHLSQGAFGMIMQQFDFAKYRQKLGYLQKKQIQKQVQKIIKETIVREQVPFDIDLTLKILATWIVMKSAKQLYQEDMNMYISPLLKYIIGANFYRSICEVLNNSFDWANMHHLTQLKRAFVYFSTVFQVARSFVSIGLQNQIVDIFYSCMVTPNKYDVLVKNQTFFSQTPWINLKNPFKIGYTKLKFKLEQNEQKIAFFASSLILQVLFLWRFVDRNGETFKTRQKQTLKNIKNQLFQLISKYNSEWFFALTRAIKKFYSTYKPPLTKQYFLLVATILNCSLNKLILQSITNEDDQQSNSQISFVVQLVTDYVQTRWNQPSRPNHLSILNQVTIQTKFKETYGNQRNNATSTMIYSSILRSLISNPIFRTEQALQSVFLKYLKEYVLPDLSNIIASLKSNIYEPVFQLLRQIYQFKVNKKFVQLNGNDDNVSHEEITNIINNLWVCLGQKYDDLTRLLKQRQSPKKFQNFLEKNECQKQIRKIKQKLSQCLKGLQLFLKFFIVHDTQQSSNPLFLSASHYYFRLKFSVDNNYFIKYLGNHKDLTQCILSNISFLLTGPNTNQRRYTSIIVSNFNTISKQKQLQLNILQHHTNPLFQEAIASINAVTLISAVEHSKQRIIAPLENTIIKFIKKNTQGKSIEGIKYSNIEQSVYCFNFFLGRLVSYISEKQANELVRIKNYLWSNLIGRYVKEIVVLIFLGGVVQNNLENKNIPIKEMTNRLRRLYSISQNLNNIKLEKDIGYAVFLYNLQRVQEFYSISDVLFKILSYRKLTGKNQSLQKGIEILLSDVCNTFKKNQRFQREKSPITIQTVRILTFCLQWPDFLIESIKLFLKEMQVISNGLSLITEIGVNETNMSILLNFFEKIDLFKAKIFKINQAMPIYISKATELPLTQSGKQSYYKKIRKILTTVRDCLKKDIKLKRIGLMFTKQFVKSFCRPQKLGSENKQTEAKILQIYLQMMKNSLLQRSAYQQLIVQNRNFFQLQIPRLMSRLEKQDSHLYSTFQSAILTCMIGRYSDLYDIKRLIGAIKKDSLLTATKKKSIVTLLQKLKKTAIEIQGNEQIVNWCKNQIFQIDHADNFQDWMDVE